MAVRPPSATLLTIGHLLATRARSILTGCWSRQEPPNSVVAAVILGATLALTGCGETPTSRPHTSAEVTPTPSITAPSSYISLQPLRFSDLPGWIDDDQDQAYVAFKKSCTVIGSKTTVNGFNANPAFASLQDWQAACAAANRSLVSKDHARAFFEAHFMPYRVVVAGSDDGLFTGYYEAALRGSWQKQGNYIYPIYRLPPEAASAAASGRALPSRSQIEAGALRGRGLELMWVDDPIDVFFLHIQGSGRVLLPDGSAVRLGYAGKNGHPYRAIGAELVRRGEMTPDEVSMHSIRNWLITHPDQASALMATNPSYVFFRVLNDDGPIGSQGVALTPGRSLAVDRSYIPLGVPLWLDTSDPLQPSVPLRRLVVAQDSGGAIRGPVRGDLFWGWGDEAALVAGLMKERGRYYALLPRSARS